MTRKMKTDLLRKRLIQHNVAHFQPPWRTLVTVFRLTVTVAMTMMVKVTGAMRTHTQVETTLCLIFFEISAKPFFRFWGSH